MKKNGSLVLVGSGIKFLSHLTTEAKVYISQSNKVLYLINEPAMKQWIASANSNAESLENFYNRYFFRKDCYQAITDYILKTLRTGQHVCVVLYGHPTVFAKPGLDAVKLAKKEGYYAKILPAISAEACLFADLLIDPGSCGCQSFETTDFLIRRRNFDPHCHLILWQVDVIGALHNPKTFNNHKGLAKLQTYLSQYYPDDHEIILYEASQYPHFEPRIEYFYLKQLTEINFSSISTLYVPPLAKANVDQSMLEELTQKSS